MRNHRRWFFIRLVVLTSKSRFGGSEISSWGKALASSIDITSSQHLSCPCGARLFVRALVPGKTRHRQDARSTEQNNRAGKREVCVDGWSRWRGRERDLPDPGLVGTLPGRTTSKRCKEEGRGGSACGALIVLPQPAVPLYIRPRMLLKFLPLPPSLGPSVVLL